MSCVLEPDGGDFVAEFTRKAMAARVPLDGSLEVTHRCNLRCQHCYLGDQQAIRRHRRDEMDTATIEALVDELVDAGTLNLTLSGGDPMVRKDFPSIYRYAASRGLRVTVFCDGILIDAAMIEVFDAHPPRMVEVTIYGATAPTYEAVTQVPGSHPRFLEGVARLAASGHRFKLKTVLMTLNRHELDAMRAFADGHGVAFHFDTAVFPCLPHGDNAGGANRVRDAARARVEVAPPSLDRPMALRISPESAAAAHASDPAEARATLAFYERTRALPADPHLYTCGAAQTTYHIDPYGNLQACTISTNVEYNVRDGGFMAGWNGPLARLRELRASPDLPCKTCDKRGICQGCPAMFAAETGHGDRRSEYVCKVTHALHARLTADARSLEETSR